MRSVYEEGLMTRPNPRTIFHAFMYGGGCVLLVINLLFLVKALFEKDYVPVVPILASILVVGGLLLVVLAEHQARQYDRREHRRLSRVAYQLEAPLQTLHEDFIKLVKGSRELPAAERMRLKKMETTSKVILENVRDVFLMLRAQGSVIATDVRIYDLCVLTKESIDRIAPLASAHNTEILQKTHCSDAPVRVDRRLFLIALVHMLENGILYSLTPGLLNVAVIRGKSFARIVVQDRGIGVTAHDQFSIFEPFVRGRKAEQFDPDGIGVGLTLARLIIREFGGTLTWRPRGASAGSEFEIRLPLVRT